MHISRNAIQISYIILIFHRNAIDDADYTKIFVTKATTWRDESQGSIPIPFARRAISPTALRDPTRHAHAFCIVARMHSHWLICRLQLRRERRSSRLARLIEFSSPRSSRAQSPEPTVEGPFTVRPLVSATKGERVPRPNRDGTLQLFQSLLRADRRLMLFHNSVGSRPRRNQRK